MPLCKYSVLGALTGLLALTTKSVPNTSTDKFSIEKPATAIVIL